MQIMHHSDSLCCMRWVQNSMARARAPFVRPLLLGRSMPSL